MDDLRAGYEHKLPPAPAVFPFNRPSASSYPDWNRDGEDDRRRPHGEQSTNPYARPPAQPTYTSALGQGQPSRAAGDTYGMSLSSASGVEITGQPNQVIKQPLRRNQACLQCRKRKLKCDAIRPHCTTCQRSHTHGIRTNSIANAILVCDYDDGDDVGGTEAEAGVEQGVAKGGKKGGNGGGGSSRRPANGQETNGIEGQRQMSGGQSRRKGNPQSNSSYQGPSQPPPPSSRPSNSSIREIVASPETLGNYLPQDDYGSSPSEGPSGELPPAPMDREIEDTAQRAKKRKRRAGDRPANDGSIPSGGGDSVREEISELKKIIREMQERMLGGVKTTSGNTSTSRTGTSPVPPPQGQLQAVLMEESPVRNVSAWIEPAPPSSLFSVFNGQNGGYPHGPLPPPPPPPLMHHPSSSSSSNGTGYSNAAQGTVPFPSPPPWTSGQSSQPLPPVFTQGQSNEYQEVEQHGMPSPMPATPNFLEMLSSAAAIESDKARPSTGGSGNASGNGAGQAHTETNKYDFNVGSTYPNPARSATGSGSLSLSASSANEASPADHSGFSADSPETFMRNAFSGGSHPATPGFFGASGLPGMSPLGRGIEGHQQEWQGFTPGVQYDLVGQGTDMGVEQANNGGSFEMLGDGDDGGMITDQVLMDILWPGWPKNIPEPTLMNHLIDMYFEHAPLINRIFDADKFRARMALPPTHHNFPKAVILHSICAATARYTARVYTVPTEDEPWRRTTEYTDMPEAEPDFGMRHATYTERAIRTCIDKASDLYEAAQASIILVSHYHMYSRWLHAWTTSGFLNRMVVPLGICDGNRRLVSMLSKPSLLGDWKDDVEREERRNLCWAAVASDVVSSAVGGWAGTIMLEEVTTPIPSVVVVSNAGNVYIESDQCIQTPDLFKRHPVKTGFTMYMKSVVLLSRINRFTRTWRSRHHTLSPEEGRSSREFADLDSMIGTFVMTFPAELRDPMKPDPNDTAGRAVNLELFMAQILLHQGTICLHEMFADVTNPADISTQRLLASARGILKMMYTLNATSLDVSVVMPAGFGFYTAARTLLLFLDHALETGSLADGGPDLLRSEIEVVRTVFDAYGARFPIGRRHSGILTAMLDACDAKYGTLNSGNRPTESAVDCLPTVSSVVWPNVKPAGRVDDVLKSARASIQLNQSPYSNAVDQVKTAGLTHFLNQRRGYVNSAPSSEKHYVDQHLNQQVHQFMNRKDQSLMQTYSNPGK